MITDDYDVMIARVMTESFGHLLEEDREKLRFLEAERSVDLGQWLTPDEITDFELAKTSCGRIARTELKLFDPTPEQLRTYYRLGRKHGVEIEGLGRNLGRIMETQRALHAALADKLKALVTAHCDFVRTRLGEAGFKEYFELNRNWLTSMQHGGAVRLSYSMP